MKYINSLPLFVQVNNKNTDVCRKLSSCRSAYNRKYNNPKYIPFTLRVQFSYL